MHVHHVWLSLSYFNKRKGKKKFFRSSNLVETNPKILAALIAIKRGSCKRWHMNTNECHTFPFSVKRIWKPLWQPPIICCLGKVHHIKSPKNTRRKANCMVTKCWVNSSAAHCMSSWTNPDTNVKNYNKNVQLQTRLLLQRFKGKIK